MFTPEKFEYHLLAGCSVHKKSRIILDLFCRQMEARGGLMYESADKIVHQLSHDALPPPLSLQNLQTGTSQLKE